MIEKDVAFFVAEARLKLAALLLRRRSEVEAEVG
jgi:hypothetical protein